MAKTYLRIAGRRLLLLSTAMSGLALVATAAVNAAPQAPPETANMKVVQRVREPIARGGNQKLSSELQQLQEYYGNAKGDRSFGMTPENVRQRYGIDARDANPSVEVIVDLAPGEDASSLEDAGAVVRYQAGRLVYAAIPVRNLAKLARLKAVRVASAVPATRLPVRPQPATAPLARKVSTAKGAAQPNPATAFDHQGLTGKGVIVAVVDSGIDWRHPAFIREDGTSRILALWDIGDDSWQESDGQIGSKPPHEDTDGAPIGTLYTNAQINAALAGQGEVRSQDKVGHGTACAGTAAGNGRGAGSGVAPGAYAGIAPEADLVIVNASTPEAEGGISDQWLLGTIWALEYSRSLGKPCVVNQSFGSNYSAKDGSDADERMLDELTGSRHPGAVICAAAGNEGRLSLHASGRFGPAKPGQQDVFSAPIELFVKKTMTLTAYFDQRDDWGLAVTGQRDFLIDDKGGAMQARFYRQAGQISADLLGDPDARPSRPGNFEAFFQQAVGMQDINDKTVRLEITLPVGQYWLQGFGTSERVPNGRFDLILPEPDAASFGQGTDRTIMVNSPGTAQNVLTVAAYDFRSSWPNLKGEETYYNIVPGALSDYSSPGFRRDGVIKPDFAAPATYAISPLAKDSLMSKDYEGNPDLASITPDGIHLAWAGTSAAAPYVAGVVALMLQKNPMLDAAQVKEILTKSVAPADDFTGALPNTQWGYGKIAPQAALKATPTAKPAAKPR